MQLVTNIQFKHIKATDTYAVRHPVLRKGLPISSCAFDRDEDNSTIHLGALLDNKLIGVLTLMRHATAMQLRGMAVLEPYQGQGVGKQLITKAEELIKTQNRAIIWMNARLIAIPFYEACGYHKEGSAFVLPYGETHYKMTKKQCG